MNRDSPQPSAPRRARLSDTTRMFGVLKYGQFRRYWFGNLAAVAGQQMMWVAQGWLVYELTNQAVYLGYVGLATALPAIILNLAGGVVADRFDQRKVILLTQLAVTVSLAVLAVLTALELVQVWHVIVVAFVSGSTQAFNNPARQAIFPQLVERKDLMNAISLNSIVWQGTRIVAPAAGGIVLALFGAAFTFALCSVGFFLLGLTVIGLKTSQPLRTRQTSPLADMKEGVRYVASNFVFAFLIGMSFFNSFFGMSTQQLMPVFTRDVLNVGEAWIGILFSISGIGAILGVGALGYLGDTDRKGLLIIGGATIYGGFVIMFAQSTFLEMAIVAMFLMGGAQTIYMITVQTVLQLRVPDELRGRVMGIHGMTYNIGPLGAIQAGIITDAFSAPLALTIAGAAIILFAVGVASSMRQVRSLQVAPTPA